MASASKFLFEQDFRKPAATGAAQAAALRAADADGFARGVAEGRRQAEADARAHLAAVADRLATGVERLLGEVDEHRATLEEDCLAVALALGRRLAGEALRERPLSAIAEVATASFQHLRGVPHLAVRVNDGLVEEVDALMRRLARERGYEGRVVVLGEPDIAPGDVRLEWADGGLVREQAGVEEAVARALAGAFTRESQI